MHTFKYNPKDNCFEVTIEDKTILINVDKFELLFSSAKIKTSSWKFDESNNFIYTINSNCKKIYLFEVICNIPFNTCSWKFNNDNSCDYRTENIKYEYKYKTNIKIPENFEIISEYNGHLQTMGKTAGTVYNPYWMVKDENLQSEPFYIMYCEPETFTLFSEDSLDKMIYDENTETIPTWFKCSNGYIASKLNKQYYMHQLIMNYYDHGNKKQSIDHINRNKLDNRLVNLRITSQSEQNRNTGKRERKHNAKKLPDGIEQKDIPKFVVYYKEKVKRKDNEDAFREFFVIEKHPKMEGKRWTTSKSNQITIVDKLKAAKVKLEEIDKI